MIEWAAIEWGTVVIMGALAIGLVGFGFILGRILKKKSKYDMHNLKKLTHDTGVQLHSCYKNVQELEKVFTEIESAKG